MFRTGFSVYHQELKTANTASGICLTNADAVCTQFIDPCIANIFAEYNQENSTFLNFYISVRRSTCFGRGFPSIIRSSKLHIQRQVLVWQMPDAVCAVLSSWWWTGKPVWNVSVGEINKLRNFYIRGSVPRGSNLITVQQDAAYSVYYISVGSSTCFGCWLCKDYSLVSIVLFPEVFYSN